MSDEVKLHVHECSEGLAVVSFTSPPKDDQKRYDFLQGALKKWLSDFPRYSVQEVRSIRFGEKLYGLEVFYTSPKPEFFLDIDAGLMQKHGREYMEAVMADAAQFVFNTRITHPIVALTNRRKITVVMERDSHRGRIVPMNQFRERITTDMQRQLDTWLAGTVPGYFAIPLDTFQP